MLNLKTSRLILTLSILLFAISLSASSVLSKQNVTLKTIRGGRHERFASIVLQFSNAVKYTLPQTDKNEFRLTLLHVTTALKPFRKYRSFDSWVSLNKGEHGLDVRIGIPRNFMRLSAFQMENPHRLVFNLYIEEAAPAPKFSRIPADDTRTIPPIRPDAPDRKIGRKPVRKPALETVKSGESILPAAEDQLQMDRIEARILKRKGFHEKSLEIYHRLREQYPEDEEIWEEHIETLVDSTQYESAQAEIGKLLRKNPDSVRAKKIQARIYMELRKYSWTFPVFDQLLNINKRDAGIWSDYAFARLDAQEWAPALNYFSRVLEIDPENTEALRGAHEILREHRPRLEAGYIDNSQEAGDARVKTAFGKYLRHVTERTVVDFNYGWFRIDRPKSPEFSAIDEQVNDAFIRLRHQFNRYWQGRIGGGGYAGLGDGTTILLGADYSPWNNLVMRADFIGKRPWYDPVDAALLDGSYNLSAISFDWRFNPSWGLFLGGEQWDYFVDDDNDYGTKRTFTGILTKRFTERPNFSLSYSYYYSHFNYEDDSFTPIAMVPTEGIHAVSGSFAYQPCTYWSFSISGGRRYDAIRSLNSWYVLPIIKIRFGNRIESSLSYEFNSESDTAAGGESETFRFWNRIIF